MRCRVGLVILLIISGCSHRRERERRDRDSAAFKVGQAAHEIAKHAEQTAAEAARALQDNARKAKEGWKQNDREEREKSGQSH
jgi:hypothetical protein